MYAIAYKYISPNWIINYNEQFECEDSAEKVMNEMRANCVNSIQFKIVEL